MEEEREITRERILGEIGKVAFGEAGDQASASLRYSNKLRALEMLARYFGVYETRPEEVESRGGVVLLGESEAEPVPPAEWMEEDVP